MHACVCVCVRCGWVRMRMRVWGGEGPERRSQQPRLPPSLFSRATHAAAAAALPSLPSPLTLTDLHHELDAVVGIQRRPALRPAVVVARRHSLSPLSLLAVLWLAAPAAPCVSVGVMGEITTTPLLPFPAACSGALPSGGCRRICRQGDAMAGMECAISIYRRS